MIKKFTLPSFFSIIYPLYTVSPGFFMPINLDFDLNVVFIGQPTSGKTSIINRWENPQYDFGEYHIETIGVQLCMKPLNLSGTSIKLHVWDTGERHLLPGVNTAYYKKENQFVYCVDLTKPLDEALMHRKIAEAKQYSNGTPTIYLVGTKSDLANRTTSTDELSAAATRLGCIAAFETSSKNNEGIQELFSEIETQLRAQIKKAAIRSTSEMIRTAPQASPFRGALTSLWHAADHWLNDSQKELIIQETNQLILSLKTADPLSITSINAIDTFYNNCRKHLGYTLSTGQEKVLKNICFLAITAVIAVLAAAVGFAIGLTIGIWQGPFAIISGITGAFSGILLADYANNRFFKSSPTLAQINNVKCIASEFNSKNPGDMRTIDSIAEAKELPSAWEPPAEDLSVVL